MLLTVAESSGSSPGRAGYKMAVASDGELCGSIGGGVMEVKLVDQARMILSEPGAIATGFPDAVLIEQVHQKNAQNSSGMICSGRQTVILKQLTSADAATVNSIIEILSEPRPASFQISNLKFEITENELDRPRHFFSKTSETEFVYQEKLGTVNNLYIIGGGHCSLALSELAARLDFRVHIFDDRPELNTIEKNESAHVKTIIDSYENIGEYIAGGPDSFVVVMTLGYVFDRVVISRLIERDFKYFGVLGSRAKMRTLIKELLADGIDEKLLKKMRTPIGLSINSRTPEEIAVSIAAEIISVKKKAEPTS